MAESRPPGRPVDREKAAAIVDAAWALFLERGVAGTSIESIAARAAVSKVTLYRHFADKAALFEAAILREMRAIELAQGLAAPDPAPLRDTLIAFGTGIMGFLASDVAIDFYNALSGELRRHPALARAFYANGPGRTRDNLAGILAGAMSRGELRAADPAQAADHLFGLWQGFSNFQLSLGIDTTAIRTGILARAESAVAVFLRAYVP